MKQMVDKDSNSDMNGLKGIFRSLRYRNYRLFFTGQSFSLMGTWIQGIALPWLVYRISGSAFLLGVVGFAGQIPAFLLAPFAGVLTDRMEKHRILIATQTLAMIQSLILAILFFTGVIEVWHIIALGIFIGFVNAFDMPARQSFVIQMVENREDLGNAIALNSSMVNCARLVGPSIAGILIAAAGEGICFLINGLSYIFVITSLLMMKVQPTKINTSEIKIFQELKEGFLYAFGFSPLRYIILLLGLISLMGTPYTILMPIFATKILHGSSHTFGFLMGGAGTGALIGALYLASRKNVVGLVKLIPISASLFGLGLIAFALSRTFLLSLALMLIIGFGMIMQMASSNTIIQTIVDDDKRGRVMSFYMMAFIGTAPFGSLLAGSLATSIGAPNTVLIAGVSCIIGAAFFASKLPELKKILHPIYVKYGIISEVADGISAATELTVPPEE